MIVLRVRIGEAGQHAEVRKMQEVLEHLRKVLVTPCNELKSRGTPSTVLWASIRCSCIFWRRHSL